MKVASGLAKETQRVGRLLDGGLPRRGGRAGFKPVCRHRVHSVAHLQLEGVKGPLQDQVWTIVQRRKRRLDAVMANQYEPGEQEFLRQGGVRRNGVMGRGKWDAAGQ